MIQINSLNKSYGKLQVLSELDASIRDGSVTAVVGHNGSGKTTLIKCILGLTTYQGGEIFINEFKLNGGWEYRSGLGYMPQIASFPENLSVKEVIELIQDLRNTSNTKSEELMETFRLTQDLDKSLKTLSGGTRQKVNAVIAFMFDPGILILDEPTAGLDPLSTSILKDRVLHERSQGKTILITSHIMSEVQEMADRILYLLDGKIFFDGPVQELIDMTGEKNLERAIAGMMR
jgi:Cu-processing system ATP-binding protein